jgi:hypothetical protein
MLENQQQDVRLNLIEFWRILISSRAMILLVVSLSTISTMIYVFSLTPIYEAKALLQMASYEDSSKRLKQFFDNPGMFALKAKAEYSGYDGKPSVANIHPYKLRRLVEITSNAKSNNKAVGLILEVVEDKRHEYKEFYEILVTQSRDNDKEKELELEHVDGSEHKNKSHGINNFEKYIYIQHLSKKKESSTIAPSFSDFNNLKLIGNIQTKNYPIEPKRNLIILIVFFISLVASVFYALLLNMYSRLKEE